MIGSVFDKAIELLETKCWIQGDYARDANGIKVDPQSSEAAGYCATGAVLAANSQLTVTELRFITRSMAKIIHHRTQKHLGVGEWNDHPERTKEEVIALLREAKGQLP